MAAGPAVDFWEKSIERSEAIRHEDDSVMDIYGAKLNVDLGSTDSAPNTPAPSDSPSALEEWIDFALAVEEKQ